MDASHNPSSQLDLNHPGTPNGLDALGIAALIYRLDAGVPLLVDANDAAKRQLQLRGRFPMADPWQWLDARQYPAAGRGHPALLAVDADASPPWQCFHLRQHHQPLQALKLKVSPIPPADDSTDAQFVLIAIGEMATVDDAPTLLPQSRSHLRQVIGNLPMAACVIDADGYLRLVNHALCEFFGYAEGALLNAHFRKLLPARHHEAAEARHSASFSKPLEPRRAVEVLLSDGSPRTVLIEDTMSRDEDGRPQRIAFLVDITERRNLERRLEEKNRRLEYLATRDALTGLHNRRYGLDLLKQALERSRRYGEKVAVVMLDLDHFKAINDQYGHPVGDAVLTEFSRFVAGSLRTSDTLIRWGGEEFLVILPGIDRFAAQSTVERVLAQLREHTLSAAALHISFSAGVSEHGHQTCQGLLEEIDQALYGAKAAGRGCVSVAAVPAAHQGRCLSQAFSSP